MGIQPASSLGQRHPVLLNASDLASVFRHRLALWAACSALAMVGVRLALPVTNHAPSAAILAASLAFRGCAGLGASIYCFADFIFSRQLRCALAAVGFFALCGGCLVQATADLSGSTPALYDWILVVAWLIASLAFVGASYSSTVVACTGRLRSAMLSTVVGVLVLGFPLAVLAYALDVTALYAFNSQPSRAFAAYVAECAVCVTALLLVLMAIRASYRRFVASRDRTSAILCFFLVPCAFALFARTASFSRFDAWWVCSQLLSLGTWLVFVCAVGVENALAHKEAQDRLEEMEVMHQVSWSLVGAGTEQELLDMLAQTVQQRLHARIATVYLADEEGQSLRTAAVAGPDVCKSRAGEVYAVLSADHRPGFHSGHTARAFLTKEVQVAEDVFVDVEFVPWRVIAEQDGCAVSLPLVDKGKGIGVLDVYFSEREQLTRQRLRLLMTIAAAASPAIEQSHSREHHATRLDVAA